MTQLEARRRPHRSPDQVLPNSFGQGVVSAQVSASRAAPPTTTVPDRLARVFELPLLAWRRLETEPLDAAYYVLLTGGAEQVLWINQRAVHEPKIARYVAATQLLPGFTAPLIRADTTLARLEHPYLITGYCPTPTLANVWPHLTPKAQEGAAHAWGAAVRLIHRIRFDLAGDLAYSETEGARLEDDLSARWQTPLRLAVKDYMLDTPKLVAALKRGQKLVQGAPVSLCHGLPRPQSFLYDQAQGVVVMALDFGNASRSDPMTDLAALTPILAELGCAETFLYGYGALSKWEKKRLAFYNLHHDLLRYALALTHLPNRLALSRMRLAATLAAEPNF